MNTNVKVKLSIAPREQEKIWWYVDKCEKEISGLGKVIRRPDGSLHVNKIYLLEQECSAVETELDDEAVAQLLYEARNDEGQMLFWWHSHVDMPTFWSGTDIEAIHQLGKAGMVLSTVYNKKRDSRTSLFVAATEYAPEMFLDDLELNVMGLLDTSETEQLEKEYDKKVTFPAPNYPNYHTHMDRGSYFQDVDTPSWGSLQGVQESNEDKKIEPTNISFMFDNYNKLPNSDKGFFKDAYADWFGQLDMSDLESRRKFLEFCEYYDYDSTDLDSDWGYSAANIMTKETRTQVDL